MALPFKTLLRELRRMKQRSRKLMSKSHIAPEGCLFADVDDDGDDEGEEDHQSPWACLPLDLFLDIIKRVEATGASWPARRDLVACAAVCRSWRDIVGEVVQTPEKCGLLTFPISLKQPGPREHPIQCFIKRERSSSTYLLYLGLTPDYLSLNHDHDLSWFHAELPDETTLDCSTKVLILAALTGEESKLLLAAKKIRRATCLDFVISLVANDFSKASSNFVGKLRSNFLGTKFTVYDNQTQLDVSTQANKRGHHRIPCGQGSSSSLARSHHIASISYELNVLRTRGPRRMHCTLHSIPVTSIQEGGTAPTPTTFRNPGNLPLLVSGAKSPVDCSAKSGPEPAESIDCSKEPLVLKNKAPRWHEQLQCWCLNFKGRVTVASVKNFQLVAAVDPRHNVSVVEQEKVILQFGKIGKDIFTMDYHYPLSAFQAFAICLSSFDTKPACE